PERERRRRSVSDHASRHHPYRVRGDDLLTELLPQAGAASRGLGGGAGITYTGREYVTRRHAQHRVYAATQLNSNRRGNSNLGLDPSSDVDPHLDGHSYADVSSRTDPEPNPDSEPVPREYEHAGAGAFIAIHPPQWRECKHLRVQLHAEQQRNPELLRSERIVHALQD